MGIRVIVTVLFFICTQKIECKDDEYFTGAVIEYHPVDNRLYTPEQRTIENAKHYVNLLKSINETVDIAVFPEDTLTHGIFTNDRKGILNVSPLIGSLNGSVIPCLAVDSYPDYFVKLSCLARELNTYLVINIVEKSVCSTDTLSDTANCSKDNWNLYNTDVVFDRNGALIARYRKFHLFHEPVMNVTKKAELSTFTTDFGVTFGIFTCFDILFAEPSLLLLNQNVQHFVYPSFWFSELPFLTGMQTQNMWAVATDAIFLAAGANKPTTGTGGSGIYAGRNGPLAMGTVTHDGSKIFVSKIPKNRKDARVDFENTAARENADVDKMGAAMDNFHLLVENLTFYSTKLIEDSLNTEFCHEEFCCNFDVSISKNQTTTDYYYRHRIAAYSGARKFGGTDDHGVQICAIISCKDDTLASCGHRIVPYDSIEWPTRFNKIVINGTFDSDENKMQYPNTLLSDIRPLRADNYDWQSVSDDGSKHLKRSITLLEPQDRLLTFGIYGRDFGTDDIQSVINKYSFGAN